MHIDHYDPGFVNALCHDDYAVRDRGAANVSKGAPRANARGHVRAAFGQPAGIWGVNVRSAPNSRPVWRLTLTAGSDPRRKFAEMKIAVLQYDFWSWFFSTALPPTISSMPHTSRPVRVNLDHLPGVRPFLAKIAKHMLYTLLRFRYSSPIALKGRGHAVSTQFRTRPALTLWAENQTEA